MINEDVLRKACKAYYERTGLEPRWLVICPQDFQLVSEVLRDSRSEDERYHIDRYVLAPHLDPLCPPGQVLVCNKPFNTKRMLRETPIISPVSGD